MAASRPSATTASLGLMAPPWMRFQLVSVASASTIMIATSSVPSAFVTMRPATVRSKTASASWLCFGKATHWPVPSLCGMSARRTPAIGPLKGRPEIWVEALAALIARAS